MDLFLNIYLLRYSFSPHIFIDRQHLTSIHSLILGKIAYIFNKIFISFITTLLNTSFYWSFNSHSQIFQTLDPFFRQGTTWSCDVSRSLSGLHFSTFIIVNVWNLISIIIHATYRKIAKILTNHFHHSLIPKHHSSVACNFFILMIINILPNTYLVPSLHTSLASSTFITLFIPITYLFHNFHSSSLLVIFSSDKTDRFGHTML